MGILQSKEVILIKDLRIGGTERFVRNLLLHDNYLCVVSKNSYTWDLPSDKVLKLSLFKLFIFQEVKPNYFNKSLVF